MPGLLDFLEPGYGTDDPRSAAYTALAAGLLGGKGSFGSILGESLLGAQNVYSRAVKDSQASQLNKAQLEEIARKAAAQKKAQAAEDAFRATLVSPQMQASQSALAGGGGPTVQNAAGMAQVDPQQQQLYKMVELGLISPVDYVKMTQKDTAPIKLGAGEKLLRPGTFQELANNPKDDAVSPVARLMAERDKFPQGSGPWKVMNDALVKASTHPPGVSVNQYGGMQAGIDPKTGRPAFGVSNKAGEVKVVEGFAPKPNADDKPTESERTAGFLLQRIRDSKRQLEQAIREMPSAAGPGIAQEAARATPLVGEVVANALTGPARQRVEAAQLDILDAALTLGTGAAYTKEQLLGYRKSYFPQLEDTAQTRKDKKERLDNLLRAAEVKAGRSASDRGVESTPDNDPLGLFK